MGRVITKSKRKIWLQILEFIKTKILNAASGKNGEITIEEDRIVCRINQKTFNKYYKKLCGPIGCNLILKNIVIDGINSRITEKSTHYIFENVDFDTLGLRIYANADEVLFKNCTFRRDIYVGYAQALTFENNQYFCRSIFPGRPNVTYTLLHAKDVKYLNFVNENFINGVAIEEVDSSLGFGMDINADVIEFNNTNVNCQHTSEFNADKMIIENSSINAPKMYIDSKSILFNNSSLNTSKENGIIIQNESGDFILGINPPIVECKGINGNIIEEKTKTSNSDIDSLSELRQNVIDNLHELLNYCEKIKEDKLKSLQDELEQQTIAEFVKRK